MTSPRYVAGEDPFLNLLRFTRHGDPAEKERLLEDYLYQKRLELHKESLDELSGKPRHPRVGSTESTVFGETNEGTSRGTFLYPIWPYPYTVNQVHQVVEMTYEFFRGSRLATTNQLQLCEIPTASLLESFQAATDYANVGISQNDGTLVVEGAFRVLDALQWSTPILLGCDLATRYIFLTLLNEVVNNFSQPYLVVLNMLKNNFNIATDAVVIMADAYFNDVFSLSFWAGDIFYNVAVIQPIAPEDHEDHE